MAEGYTGETKCGICLSDYCEPRLLECFHIFCTHCLAKLKEENKDIIEGSVFIVCPLCRVKTIIPPGPDEFNGLQLYPFQVIPKTNDSDVNCQWCDDEKLAEFKCLDCKELLCRECREYHKKLKKFKHHETEATGHALQKTLSTVIYKTECWFHKKENSSFCKPCNELICSDCCKTTHNLHKTRPLMQEAALQRNVIGAGIGALKSRIEIVDQVLDKAKSSKDEYLRSNVRTKSEMVSYLKSMKLIISNTIDAILDSNVCKLAEFEKKDTKMIETFIDETERNKLSLLYLIKTAEDLVHFGSDEEIMKLSNGLCSQITCFINNFCGTMPDLYPLCYKAPDYKCDDIIRCCGKIDRSEIMMWGEALSPKFSIISLPMLLKVDNFTLISEFDAECSDICFDQNEGVWFLSKSSRESSELKQEKCLDLYTSEGKIIKTINIDDCPTQILKGEYERVYCKSGNSIKAFSLSKESSEEELYAYSRENMGRVCALDNGSFLIYDRKEAKFLEINENKDVCNIVECQYDIINMMRFIKLSNGTIVVSARDGVYTVSQDGEIQKSSVVGSGFKGICKDKYGNIFVANCSDNKVHLVDDRLRYHNVVLSSKDDIYNPVFITIDRCSNLWVVGSGTCMIFSYLR